MDREIRRVRLNAPWDGWEAKLDLKAFVTQKKFGWDPEPRFRVIEAARCQLIALDQEDFADDPTALAESTWPVFLKDDQMRAYVLNEQQQDITKDEDWRRVAETYAYVVLQRYNQHMEKQ